MGDRAVALAEGIQLMTTTMNISAPTGRRSRRPKLLVLFATLAGLFLLSACHLIGSGTVVSITGHDKATFTFDLTCNDSTEVASGTLTYIDTPARVQVHATVPGTPPQKCGSTLYAETFNGNYTALKGGSGTFSLMATLGGTAQSPAPGFFSITFYGGPYDGYTNSGLVQWGNIVSR